MADTPNPTTTPLTPTVVEADGWVAESSSMIRPSETEMKAILEGKPAEEKKAADQPANDADVVLEDGEPAPPVTAKPGEQAPQKKRETFAERAKRLDAEIGKKRWELGEHDRQIAARKAELDRLDREAVERRAGAPKKDDTPPPAAAADKAGEEAEIGTRPTWKAYEADGKDFDDYSADLETYLTKKAVRDARLAARAEFDERDKKAKEEHERTTLEREAATFARDHNDKIDATRKSHPDFDQAIENLRTVPQSPAMNTIVRLHPGGGELLYHLSHHVDEAKTLSVMSFPLPVVTAIRESAPEELVPLMSYLATNPQEVARIGTLSPASAFMALGQIKASLRGASGSTASPQPGKSVSNAAPPTMPIGGSNSVSAGARDLSDPSSGDVEFDQWFNAANAKDPERTRATHASRA